ncbi:hypothetical protein F5Y09DRAFT_297531 [Xylaria sp. FL1042]|nr:hypothetical protein F5Y09DRAFT_297531 [Xylaria sp. FL1042]
MMFVLKGIIAIWPLLGVLCLASPLTSDTSSRHLCRTLPGDADWPSIRDWSQLNKTIGGRLIATSPRASVCHNPTFNEEACADLEDTWHSSAAHVYWPAEVIDPLFQGNSCIPFTPRDIPCTTGILASYSINISSIGDIQAGLEFARSKNVRLVIKNTGHDLLGKSTGKGSLALWTHNMNEVKFIDSYQGDSSYTGSAVRLGAGVIFKDVLPLAQQKGLRLLAGSCATVGATGGYTAGGGHGGLTSQYGMAADSVLEWEVVTAEGEHLTATPKRNADLYWALSGGGAGTFAVVVSMTTRTYQDGPLNWASFQMSANDPAFNGSVDAFWSAVDTFQSHLGPLADQGTVATYDLSETDLTVFSMTMPGGDLSTVTSTLAPLTSALEKQGVALNLTMRSFDSFWSLHSTVFGAAEAATHSGQASGGRLVPRSVVEDASGVTTLGKSFRAAIQDGFQVSCTGLNATLKAQPSHPNSVHPLWRSTLLTCLVFKFWDYSVEWDANLETQAKLTNVAMPRIIAASPGGGAYLNEANFEEPNWQSSFYGSNYPRLKSIKNKYDPQGLFYARTAVGSEAWAEDGSHRLCQVP